MLLSTIQNGVRLRMEMCIRDRYEQTKITLECEGETFFAEGNVPLNRGYKEVTAPDGDESGKVFPALKEGEVIRDFSLKKTEGKTKPPARFTEGTLLKAMENPVKYIDVYKRQPLYVLCYILTKWTLQDSSFQAPLTTMQVEQ